MVKLLRIESNEHCEFDCSLKDSLIIQPYSKIALNSISWAKNYASFEVDSTNNEISIEFIDPTNGTTTLTAVLTNGIYSYILLDNLIADIENKLNNMLVTSTAKAIGLSFTVEVDSDNLCNIKSYQNNLIDFFRLTTDTDKTYVNIGIEKDATVTTSSVYKKTSSTTSYDSALFGKNDAYFFNTDSGCGVFRCQIYNLDEITDGNTGFLIGLSSIVPTNMGGNFDFSIEKYDFAIEVRNQGENYRFIKNVNGTKTLDSRGELPIVDGVGAITNDIIEICCSLGKIEGRIYKNAVADPIILFSESYADDLDALFPIIAFKNKANCAIHNLRYTPLDEQLSLSTEIFESYDLGSTPPSQQRNNIDFKLTFKDSSLSDFLGFRKQIYELTAINVLHITAVNIIEAYDLCESYIVELQSLPISSYDMSLLKEKRRSILALIFNQKNKAEKDVLFEPHSPLMIELNNAHPILLKNLKMRVLNTNEESLNIIGTSNAVLIIDSPQ